MNNVYGVTFWEPYQALLVLQNKFKPFLLFLKYKILAVLDLMEKSVQVKIWTRVHKNWLQKKTKTKSKYGFFDRNFLYIRKKSILHFIMWLIASSSSCSLKPKGPHSDALVFTFLAKYVMLMSTDGALKCSWLNIKAKCLQINRWR